MGLPMNERRYLSIGEVLGLLLEEFPDVTISKIRFLESQGLIDPERTPSGYRKFYDTDVDRLRVILREQRQNYLPLKVIKDRLDSGELGNGEDNNETPTGGIRLPRPRGAQWFEPRPDELGADGAHELQPELPIEPAPAAAASSETAPSPPAPPPPAPPASPAPVAEERSPNVLTADELCKVAGVTPAFLADLESFGILPGRPAGAARLYDHDAVDAVIAGAELCRRGLEPRHLRVWRTSVDKELSLVEQLVGPILQQHQGRPHEHAKELAQEIDTYGEQLRIALTRTGLRQIVG